MPNSGMAQVDLDRTVWLLEQLTREVGRDLARGELRRSIEESRAAWTSGDEGHWWKPILEAADGQGLRCRLADCGLDQLLQVADEGACVVVETRQHGLAILEFKRGRYRLLLPGKTLRIDRNTAQEVLRPSESQSYRCLIVVEQEAVSHGGEPTPLQRLIRLFRPDLGDIWTVLIYAMVSGLLALATPLAVEALVNTVAFGRFFQPVIILSIMLLAFLSFAGALKALQTFVVEILQQRLFARVAGDLAYRLPRTPIAALDGSSGRELVNRFLEVVLVQKITAQLLLEGVSIILGMLIGMAVLAFYHPFLLGFDLVLLALLGFTVFTLGRGAVETSIKESKQKYHMLAWLEELGGCLVAFRHGGAQDLVLERTDKLAHKYLEARKKHFRILMRQILFALGVQAVASTVLLGLGGWLVINQQLSLGQLVAAELIVGTIVGGFAKLGKHLEGYYDLMASMDKLGALFDLPIEEQTGLLSFEGEHPAEVDVNHVSYHHDEDGPTLQEVNLHLEAGARVALVGPSGSGKSILLDLIFGIRRPTGGHLMINGVDPRDFRPDVLRRHIALVREIEAFEGTVAENVHLGRPEISSTMVRRALEDVGLLDDILHLHDGIHSELGPHGSPLTTNQLRRLMLARAIVGQPRLLLVDGLLDALPDHVGRDLLALITRSDQPWTLLLVSGHDNLKAGLRLLDMSRISGFDTAPNEETHHVG